MSQKYASSVKEESIAFARARTEKTASPTAKDLMQKKTFKATLAQKKLLAIKTKSNLAIKKATQTKHKKTTTIHAKSFEQDVKNVFDDGKLARVPFDNCLFVTAEKHIEKNPELLAAAKIGANVDDDINRLIKKMTLSFTAKKDESQFSIACGVFQGARFILNTNNRDVSLRVSNASVDAETLLYEHQHSLQTRLSMREINLTEIRFFS